MTKYLKDNMLEESTSMKSRGLTGHVPTGHVPGHVPTDQIVSFLWLQLLSWVHKPCSQPCSAVVWITPHYCPSL